MKWVEKLFLQICHYNYTFDVSHKLEKKMRSCTISEISKGKLTLDSLDYFTDLIKVLQIIEKR